MAVMGQRANTRGRARVRLDPRARLPQLYKRSAFNRKDEPVNTDLIERNFDRRAIRDRKIALRGREMRRARTPRKAMA